ncbi:7-cyano-7-deazaguanine/7-aminomethyl-7-deazaguanine transporter [Rodentibacter caecimuris]|uniref:Probable queuosine precursor transporter n=1 Tax=Rodentibacter caecimuris TaxID=1796644 RepID=A0ABX3KZQ6_9PAST|nr:hypothetical protein BKG89_01645 [Rodentibacter heylii]
MIANPPVFSERQKHNALFLMTFFHIFIITSSNYLVQIPFEVHLPFSIFSNGEDFSFHSTWGTLTFPFIFLATDLTVRIFGAKAARRIIFMVMIPALMISYAISVLFSEGQYQGLGILLIFNIFVFRIAIASFCAYVFGQLLDIFVFNRLRQLRIWWGAPSCSMVLGSLADTFLFFCVAFYQSNDVFMAENWLALGFVDYLFKLFVGLLLFVPAYGLVLNYLLRQIQTLASNSFQS